MAPFLGLYWGFTVFRIHLHHAALLACGLVSTSVFADELLFSSPGDLYTTTHDSIVVTGAAPVDQEIADDFQAVGEIHRAVVDGYDCWNCEGVFATGVDVHIYAKGDDGKPGDLLYGFRLDASDPRFIHDLNQTGHNGTIDVTFPEPFAADGQYFLSVQLEYNRPASWPIWSANHITPFGSPVQIRDNIAGTPWEQHSDMFGPSNYDFSFALYGLPPGPPPSNTVAECGEWSTELLPQPPDATSTAIRDSKSFGTDETWLVGSYDTGITSQIFTYSLAYHRVGDGPWEIVPTPSPDACSDSGNPNGCPKVWFNAIDGVTPDDLWAGGWRDGQTSTGFFGGQIFLAHWDGNAWTQVPAPVSSGSGSYIGGIKAVAPDDVWFVGAWIADDGWKALALHWNGSTLEMVDTPFPAQGGTPGWSLDEVDGVAGNDLWAVGAGSDGDMSLAPYVLHSDGNGWTVTPDVPMPGDWIEFNALLPLASDDVYMGGSWFAAAGGYGPLILHWDGSAWTIVSGEGGGGPMITFGNGTVLATGNPTLYWNGSQWLAQPRLGDYDFYGFSALKATGPCHAVGAAIVDIVGVQRSVAVYLNPIVYRNGFE